MFLVRPILFFIVLGFLEMTLGQGFYSTRYGKRAGDAPSDNAFENNEGQSGFYSNRYGRSSSLPEIKIRSSRFIGGSRYGKRAPDNSEGNSSNVDLPQTIDGDTFDCIVVNLPNLYRCQRKTYQPSEETIN